MDKTTFWYSKINVCLSKTDLPISDMYHAAPKVMGFESHINRAKLEPATSLRSVPASRS